MSSDLELEYGVIVSPTVIPSEEFDHYKNVLPYYRNIEKGGVNIMRDEYDIENLNPRKNPYLNCLKKQITINIDNSTSTIEYFKDQSKEN